MKKKIDVKMLNSLSKMESADYSLSPEVSDIHNRLIVGRDAFAEIYNLNVNAVAEISALDLEIKFYTEQLLQIAESVAEATKSIHGAAADSTEVAGIVAGRHEDLTSTIIKVSEESTNIYQKIDTSQQGLTAIRKLSENTIDISQKMHEDMNQLTEIINSMKTEYANSSLSAKALFEQGRAHVLSGRTDEANAIFQSIIIKHPGSEYAKKASEEIANMAANIAIQDSIAAAQDSIETAAAKAPVLAAQELYDGGQYQIAEQQILAAIDKGIARPYWLPRAFILLSDIYKAEGRTIEAKQTLESLKANYKEEDDIQEMINQRLQ